LLNISSRRPFTGRTARTSLSSATDGPSLRAADRASKSTDDPDEILKVGQLALPGRRQGGAEWITGQRFAECVPHGPLATQRDIDPDGRAEHGAHGPYVLGGRRGRLQPRLADGHRFDSYRAAAHRQIRPD